MRRVLLSLSLCLTLCVTAVQAAPATITVKKGDTLYSISRKNGLTLQQLRDLNGLKDNSIQVGQVLKVTGSASPTPQNRTPVKPAPTPATKKTTGEVTYTVKAGDTLGKIAARHSTSIAHLKNLNGLTGNGIHVGQVLKLTGTPARKVAVVPTPRKVTPTPAQATKPTPKTPTPKASAEKWYTVKAGDTLGRIAQRHAVSVQYLKNMNGLTGNTIQVGQKLKLTGTPARANAVKPTPSPAPARTSTYTVKAGDTLGNIANQYGVSITSIQTSNNLKSDTIAVGQRLSIPPRGAAASKPRPPALPPGMEARLVYSYERVKANETPDSFAGRFSTTPAQVRTLNTLSTINQIMPGAKLLVPRRMAVPIPPRASTQAVRYRSVNVAGVNVQVVQVNLRHRNVLVAPVLPTRGLNFGTGATVRSLTRTSGARALVNGSYFHPHTYAPAGDIVMQGRLLTWGRIPAALAITPDNRASIQGTGRGFFTHPNDSTWAGMETVIASGPRIVSGGNVTSSFSAIFRDPAVFSAASRSAIGLISNRDLLMVSTHAKVSVTQMGRIMATLGARDALLLDGGSSAGISWNGSVLLDSIRKVSYGIGVFTNYTGRRYSR